MAETVAKPVPQPAPAAAGPKTGHLTLDRVLADLVTDKLVAKEDADKLLHERRHNRSEQHPLVVISEQKYKDPRHPKKDRKSTRLNSSHIPLSRMPSSA